VGRRVAIGFLASAAAAATLAVIATWDHWAEKRVRVIVPGRLVRGAWQQPGPLRRLIAREKIKTIVTLTAINADDPKYVAQAGVVKQTGVDWVIVPMRGSRATLEQMAEAADLLADPSRQPVFFHCVAGHHRTSLAHAAYRVRHDGWAAARAWHEVATLPWARPDAAPDRNDQRLIEAFAADLHRQPSAQSARSRKDLDDERKAPGQVGRPHDRVTLAADRGFHRLEPRD
jgi:protein tyrosine phosphatase (PTP) superfamily phosphohydrolase (DUF442 family)